MSQELYYFFSVSENEDKILSHLNLIVSNFGYNLKVKNTSFIDNVHNITLAILTSGEIDTAFEKTLYTHIQYIERKYHTKFLKLYNCENIFLELKTERERQINVRRRLFDIQNKIDELSKIKYNLLDEFNKIGY